MLKKLFLVCISDVMVKIHGDVEMKKILLILLIILLTLTVYGCQTKTVNKKPSEQKESSGQNKIEIKDLAFEPDTITVSKGTKVTWTNNDSVDHTVTADDGSFDSGTLGVGKTFSYTFNKTGSLSYKCTIHPSMTGTVKVK